MTTLRLDPVGGKAIDVAAAVALDMTFHRRAEALFAEVPSADVPAVVRALAYAGIDAQETRADLLRPSGHIPLVSRDLEPAPSALLASDVVRVHRLSLGQATAEVLRRRFAVFRAPSVAAQVRCRRLLRGDDALLAWERIAWIESARVRVARSRSSMRPIVFDRGALDRRDLRGRAFVSDGALGRWAFG